MKAHAALIKGLVLGASLLVEGLFPGLLRAQNATLARIITTVAGNGTFGYSGDGGPATGAELKQPFGVATDSAGNLYIADTTNHRIRKVDTSGTITTVAGSGTSGYSGDGGPATSAEIYGPMGVAVDSAGNLYIADTSNQRIRKVDTSGAITTVAGNGTFGFSGDGSLATGAQLGNPTGVAVDSAGNLYVADQSTSHVRKVNTSGFITTVAGGGSGCAGQTDAVGDGCSAASAQLNGPYGVAVDSAGSLYIADTGYQRIRKVNSSGVITTVAGSAAGGYSGDGGPATSAELSQPTGVVVDSAGNLYIGDSANQRVRMVDASGTITTVGGNGTAGYAGDNGPATSAELYNPNGVAVDSAGNLYIAEYVNNRIRKVAASGQAPTITSANSATFQVGTAGSFSVTATGTPAATLSETGGLPSGVIFNASTGVLGGTPAAGTGGTYNITFGANNGIGSPASQSFTLTVDQSPAITSAASTALTVGTAGSFSVAGTGFPAPTFSASSMLPNGVTFSSTGLLSGTPTAGTGGTYPIVITASNGISPNATQSFSLAVKDFSFATISPISVSVGGSASPSVTVNSLGGFNSPVALSLSTPPSGVSASLSSASVTPTGNSTLNLSLGPSVIPSTFNLTVTGVSGSLSHTATATVTVTASTSTIATVIQQLLNAGCIDNAGIATALTSKLQGNNTSAQYYIGLGDSLDAINALTALKNQLNAQSGKHIAASCTIGGVTFNAANVLLADAQSLINSLRLGSLADPITGYAVNSSGAGIPGATVTMITSGGSVVATATTDITGFYYFATTGGVLTNNASYTIQITGFPAGYTSATPTAWTFTWGGSGFTLNFSLN